MFVVLVENLFISNYKKGLYIQIIKGLRLDVLSGWLLICLWFNAAIAAYWKQLSSLFSGFIVAFFIFSHLGESVYDLTLFRLFYKIDNAINHYYRK